MGSDAAEPPSPLRGWDLGLELADGVRIGPETGFRAASGLDPAADRAAWDAVVPSDGSLPAAQLAALGAALTPFTTTPGRCAFCFWVGCGFFVGRGGCDVVRLPHREHFLFTGPLALAQRAFRFEVWEQSPSMWWPGDRAWFVATEVDGYSTYVGGSAACIGAVLAAPGLEAIPVAPDSPMDPGPYG